MSLFFAVDRFPPSYLSFSGTDRAQLCEAIVARFSPSALEQALNTKGGVDWNTQIAVAGLEERVFALIETLHYVGQLHWLILLANLERPHYEPLEQLLVKVTPPIREDATWPADPRDDPPGPPPQDPPGPPPQDPPGDPVDGATNGRPAAPQQAQAIDPWHRLLLRDNRAFLDRKKFRDACQLVGLGGSRPILSVVGPQDSGKSYTARYLVDVAKELDGNRSLVTKEIRLDRLNGVVEAGASSDVGGLRLARRLSEAITEQPLPDYIERTFGSEQDATWAADTASWLSSNALSPPMRWIIFDGFQSTVLSPSAHSLVNSLLAEVASEGRIRIGLLGYLGNLGWCAPAVREVHLDLETFMDEERLTGYVLSYLLEVSKEAQARGLPPIAVDDVLTHTRQVLSRINPSAPNLHDLESALTEIAERVLVGVQ